MYSSAEAGICPTGKKNETRALGRLFCVKRVKKDSKESDEFEEDSTEDIFNKGIQSIVDCSKNKDEIECFVAFRDDTGNAALTVDNGIEKAPEVPKGFHDIQYISDPGINEKWYEAVRKEHQKSEDNCTFEWISCERLEGLRKAQIPILRHVWVFKLKRDDDRKYTVYGWVSDFPYREFNGTAIYYCLRLVPPLGNTVYL